MKIHVGNRLLAIREERKLTQQEMAELLSMSLSSYARLEKNQVSPSIEEMMRYSQNLNVPFQDLLPDSITINNKSENQSGGVVFLSVASNTNNYYGTDSILSEKDKEIEALKKELELLKLAQKG
jgi:transcriptional regulator with XRE-family HTH domain